MLYKLNKFKMSLPEIGQMIFSAHSLWMGIEILWDEINGVEIKGSKTKYERFHFIIY